MENTTRASLDIRSWRAATSEELRAYLDNVRRGKKVPSVLAVRQSLSPVDVYCYLKARFGEPNGFQSLLRGNHSANWIHWDFHLKAGEQDICIWGASREIHFLLSARMADDDWRTLISVIKGDFERVGHEKSAVFKALEKWVIFPNKFASIAAVCADLHSNIAQNAASYKTYKTPSADPSRRPEQNEARRLLRRLSKAHRSSLELSLLTPVLAEAFINMTILMLCKTEVRNNARQFEEFIRSDIDAKLFDLAYKCDGFVRPIDQHSETFKNFKRVMDKRNHRIHGNCDPEREQVETVYFEGTTPLFKDPGDHIAKFLQAQDREYQPEAVVKDYEDTHAFLGEIVSCLDPAFVEAFRTVIDDHYPGYDIRRKKMGALFPIMSR